MAFVHMRRSKVLPSLKCLSCGQMAVLSKLLWGELHYHVYECPSCGRMNASPTQYSKCAKYGLIAKDLAANDCLLCPIPMDEGFDVQERVCPYYLRKITMEEFVEEMNLLLNGPFHKLKGKEVIDGDSFKAK